MSIDGLLASISAAAGSPLAWARPPQPLTGGFWAEMWKVRLEGSADLADRDLVARVMPDPEVAIREIIVQQAAADAGVATPAVRLSGGEDRWIAQRWMLMDFVDGSPLVGDLDPRRLAGTLPALIRDLPTRLAETTAQLHDVDTTGVSARLQVVDDIDELMFRIRARAEAVGASQLVERGRTLRAARPPTERAALCHGDIHPLNVLIDGADTTLLDWSTGRLAHPAYDLAYTSMLVANPPLDAPGPLQWLLTGAGRRVAQRFMNEYESRCGRIDPEQMAWFGDLHAWRMLGEIATWRATGSLEDHRGHPFLQMEHRLTTRLFGSAGRRR